jgi:hypothetical protein
MGDNNNDLPSLDHLLGGIDSSDNMKEKEKKKEEIQAPQKTPEKKSGNAFHKAFQQTGGESGDFLDNIHNYKEQGIQLGETEEEEVIVDPIEAMRKKEADIFAEQKKKYLSQLLMGKGVLGFSAFALVASFLTFSLLLDTPSKGLLGFITGENYGYTLEQVTQENKLLTKEYRKLNDDITEEKDKILYLTDDNPLLKKIISERIDWIKILSEINEVRCYADPDSNVDRCMEDILNNSTAFNPFTFENYTTKGDLKNGEIQVLISGKVYGSQGYIFKKTAKLIETFNQSEFFSGASTDRFSKTEDNRLGYYMPFSVKLTYHKEEVLDEDETDETNKKK